MCPGHLGSCPPVTCSLVFPCLDWELWGWPLGSAWTYHLCTVRAPDPVWQLPFLPQWVDRRVATRLVLAFPVTCLLVSVVSVVLEGVVLLSRVNGPTVVTCGPTDC